MNAKKPPPSYGLPPDRGSPSTAIPFAEGGEHGKPVYRKEDIGRRVTAHLPMPLAPDDPRLASLEPGDEGCPVGA